MIVIVEPQCRGMEHEQFNAALLHGYCQAHPEERVVFWAEREHIHCVRQVLLSTGFDCSALEFEEFNIPEAGRLSKLTVMVDYYRELYRLLAFADRQGCAKIVFFSAYAYNLFPLKWLLRSRFQGRFKLHIMMHGAFEAIKASNIYLPGSAVLWTVWNRMVKLFGWNKLSFDPGPVNRYGYEKLFKSALYAWGNNGIVYYVFRDQILQNLKKYLPRLRTEFRSIDLPYLFRPFPEPSHVPGEKIIFATIGRGDIKSVRALVKALLTEGVGEDSFEVHILGRATCRADDPAPIKFFGGSHALSRAEIETRIQAAHFALFFYAPDAYELTTSGAFFDAIAYNRPVLFTQNKCLNAYFQRYRFGLCCDSLVDLVVQVKQIVEAGVIYDADYISEIRRFRDDLSINETFKKLEFAGIYD